METTVDLDILAHDRDGAVLYCVGWFDGLRDQSGQEAYAVGGTDFCLDHEYVALGADRLGAEACSDSG